MTKVKVVLGDITKLKTDAIVNAANVALRGGGGVDGAIHRAAGTGLLEELIEKYPDGIVVGEAVATFGQKLEAMYVIHAVGPRYYLGRVDHGTLLADAYRNSMRLANDLGCKSIAFPSISTGVCGYPIAEAAEIAFCCFDDQTADVYQTLLQ